MRMVVVFAAVPRARAIVTAAGVLRALPVVVADRRVLADAFMAVAALAAVPVIAALGAGASLRIPVLAADETVAAVDLRAAVAAGGGDFEHAAVVAKVSAAIGQRCADTRIADLAVAAVAIVAAVGAVAAVTRSAAQHLVAAAQLLIGADARRRNAIAGANRDAFVVTAFLALAAFAEAGPVGAIGAIRASVGADTIDARLAGVADDPARAAVLIVWRIEVDAVDTDAIDIAAGFAWRATALDDFANPAHTIDDSTSVWLDTGGNADAAIAGLARGAHDPAGAAILIVGRVQIDAVDTDAVDIAAGFTSRTIADFVADIVDTRRERAGIGLAAIVISNALHASRVVRIATDEETKIAATVSIGATGVGAGAALDISTANRPLSRALATGCLRPRQIEARSNGDAANQTSK